MYESKLLLRKVKNGQIYFKKSNFLFFSWSSFIHTGWCVAVADDAGVADAGEQVLNKISFIHSFSQSVSQIRFVWAGYG